MATEVVAEPRSAPVVSAVKVMLFDPDGDHAKPCLIARDRTIARTKMVTGCAIPVNSPEPVLSKHRPLKVPHTNVLPPAQMMMHPGPGVDGPGPGVLGMLAQPGGHQVALLGIIFTGKEKCALALVEKKLISAFHRLLGTTIEAAASPSTP